MAELQWQYYQFRKQHRYAVYIRLKKTEVSANVMHVISEQGFEALSMEESKKIPVTDKQTRILTLSIAQGKALSLIQTSDALDAYGSETLALYGGIPHYTYRQIGLLSLPQGRPLWDLYCRADLTTPEQLVGLRVMIVRFLAYALMEQGVLFYWGTLKGHSVELMKQAQSKGEAVLIDPQKKLVISPGASLSGFQQLRFLRRDKEWPAVVTFQKEEFISYLSVSHCLLSFSALHPAMKRSVYEIGQGFLCSAGPVDVLSNL